MGRRPFVKKVSRAFDLLARSQVYRNTYYMAFCLLDSTNDMFLWLVSVVLVAV